MMQNLAFSAGFFRFWGILMSFFFSIGKTSSPVLTDKATMSIAVGSGTTVGVGVAKGVENYQSMLNSSFADIIAGNFTWYGSDIAFVVGTSLSILGIALTAARWLYPKSPIQKHEQCGTTD